MHLKIAYGTDTGTAEQVSLALGYRYKSAGFRVSVVPMDDTDPLSWCAGDAVVVFVIATAGQGDMPATARRTWNTLRFPDAPRLEGLRYAVFGLGDSTYSKFNYAAKMLHNRLQQLGAAPLIHRGLGDEEDTRGISQELEPWVLKLSAALGAVPPEHEHVLNRFVAPLSQGAVEQGSSPPATFHSNCKKLPVVSNQRLTAPSHYQRVHHISFRRGDLTYQPGDTLNVFPENTNDAIRAAAARLAVPLTHTVVVSWNTETFYEQRREDFLDQELSVSDFLRQYVDLSAIATQSFLRLLSQRATDEEDRERLAELGSPANWHDYVDYCYRERRTAIEVLEDFANVTISFADYVSHVQLLRARQYSISSAPSRDADVIDVTVALFELTTPYKRIRNGLCSTALCDAREGDCMEASIGHSPFGIPPERKLLLIGPGTGVAPLRSLIRERSVGGGAEAMLFFGCRSEKADYLFRHEWPDFKNVQVVTAFSRDGPRRVYVQHRMLEDQAIAKSVFQFLREECAIIICGNAKRMPVDVVDALSSIFAAGANISPDEARTYMSRLPARGLLFYETWSV